MKLTKNNILEALLLCLTDSKYIANFSKNNHEYANLGYKATTSMNSNIRVMLEGFATSLEQEFNKFDLIEEKMNLANYASFEDLILSPTGPELLAKFDKEREKYNAKKLAEDMERQAALEASWNSEESKARDEADFKEQMETAERCAKNIAKLNGIID